MWRVLVLFVAVARGHHHHHNQHGSTTAVTPPAAPVTVTPMGSIRGSWLETRGGRRVQAYRGVRYAEPPTGERRFQPPQPILNYSSEVDAREEGPACSQPVYDPDYYIDENCLRPNIYVLRVRKGCGYASLLNYSSEVDATEEGPACPQPVYDPDYYIDEDCLRLNVYTPEKKPAKPLPVLVYIHSGGFYSISGRSDVAGPDYLLDKDLVLVTINYRLASLGFLSTGDKFAPGNNGFKDQVAALQWVKRNIAAFGGDAGAVTISGCSAGAFSVMLHMVSPMSKGLFHQAISISGSPISQVAIRPHQKELAVKQAELLGCPTTSSEAIINCLKTKPWREIGNSLDRMFTFGYDPVLLWAPIVEPDVGQTRFLVENPLDSVTHGRMHPVPYIIGQTTREFFWKAFSILNNSTYTDLLNTQWDTMAPVAFLLPPPNAKQAADRLKQAYLGGKPLTNDSQTADGLGKLYGDSLIGFGAHRLANLMSRHSPHKVFYYEFAYVGNNSHYVDPDSGKPVGAAHHDDLIYLFGLPASFPLIPRGDTPDSHMVDFMTGMLYNFMKTGDPNPIEGGTHWPAFTPASHNYLRVDSLPEVKQNMFEDRFRVWDELYPLQG